MCSRKKNWDLETKTYELSLHIVGGAYAAEKRSFTKILKTLDKMFKCSRTPHFFFFYDMEGYCVDMQPHVSPRYMHPGYQLF